MRHAMEAHVMTDLQARPYWSSMTSYLLVTTGAVVGLGNIIRFPFYIYKFGGMFFLLFILCELLICIPLLFADLLIGRRGKQNPVGSFSIIAMESGANPIWSGVGWICFIILFLSLASYAVAVSFPTVFFINLFSTTANLTLPQSTLTLEICLFLFLFLTMLVILRGINRGLETISRITVPLYFVILLGLSIYSCVIGNPLLALNHLFDFTPDDTFMTVFFAALGYAFFKLNVGMGTMIVYGSYLPYSVPLGRSTLIIICLDAIVSLLAYFVIAPLFHPDTVLTGVLSYQETLYLFLQNQHSHIIGIFFFLAAIIAAWTPAIAIAESATITLIERFDLSRRSATCIIFAGAALLGSGVILAYEYWGNLIVFRHWSVTRFIDGVTATFLIPVSALLTAIFVGWVVKRDITESELGFKPKVYGLWRFLVRWVAPVIIVGTMVMLVMM